VLDPSVQYARTTDGVNIAYAAFGGGDGVPLICLRAPQSSHMGLEWQLPFETRWHEFETLAQNRLVVRFDTRSCGLSDRGIEDLSLEARCRDIDAVADKLGLERFALQGQIHASPWAIAYAATRPERVSHLILVHGYSDGADYWGIFARAALEPLAAVDWVTYTEASMSNAFGWAPGDLPRALAAQMRASITQDDFLRYLEVDKATSVTDILPRVTCPSLVVSFELAGVTSPEMARRLVAALPDGRMLLPRGLRDSLAAYNEFLDERQPEPESATEDPEHMLRIFLVANSSQLPGTLEAHIGRHSGTAVSALPGAVAGLFSSAQSALECAAHLAETSDAGIGLHAGEGGGNSLEHADPSLVTAVRAAAAAAQGQVIVTSVVRELVAGKGFSFEPIEDSEPSDDSPRLFALRQPPQNGQT